MKVAIIGNSHTAALKGGWDQIGNKFNEVSIDFYAARQRLMADLIVDGKQLVPKTSALEASIEFTSGGKKSISVDNYDIFVICGLQNRPFFLPPNTYSDAVAHAACIDHYNPTINCQILQMIRQITNKKVFIIHVPMRASIESQTVVNETLKIKQMESYLHGLRQLNNQVFMPLNTELVGQPLETIRNGRETLAEFSVGSKELSIGDRFDDKTHKNQDNSHMNYQFGSIVIHDLVKNHFSNL